MIIKAVSIREDQASWLREQGRTFNLSEYVRDKLDERINGRREG